MREKLLIVLLSLITGLALTGCRVSHHAPLAAKGVLDLRNWQFERDGSVALKGEYEFYWQHLLTPDSFAVHPAAAKSGFIHVQGSWNGYKVAGRELGGEGYGTYRLTVLLGDTTHPLALKFLDMGTTYSVFLNGDKVLTVGHPGRTAETSVPRYFPQIVDFVPKSHRLELLFQVSNFHHRRGGAWEVIRLGTKKQIHALRQQRLAFDLILFGSILIMGLYHLALFALRKQDHSLIYFGLFCLLIALRLLTTDERFLLYLFPGLSWEIFEKIEYLSYYLSVPVFGLFLKWLFPRDIHKSALLFTLTTACGFSLVVLVTPTRFFSQTMVPYQLFTVLVMAYAVAVLIAAMVKKREGSTVILVGFLFLFATVVNDILDADEIIQTGHFVHLGLFVFIFSQAFLLSFRFSRAFKTIATQKKLLLDEIADRKQAEKQQEELREKLHRSQKMEALGRLAGGVAHNLNNILTGLVTYPDLMLLDLEENSEMKELLETIKHSGLRAAAVVQDLLTLARRDVATFEVVNLNRIVDDYLASPEYEQLRLEYPNVVVETELDPELLNINGATFHLKKTLASLTDNAAEAQPEGGRILVKTENRYLDRPVKGYETIAEGDYVVLTVQDHGPGIAQQDLAKIFEPFYTKKALGRGGTGLGMTIVWGTVHDHRGYVDIASGEGKGTRFELYLPVGPEQQVEARVAVPIEDFMGKNELILVVDDLYEQREIASRILKRLGYRVHTAASGEEAIRFVQTHAVDLVILDMIMEPGMDGLETYQRISAIRPGMKAILASGYAETDRVKLAMAIGAGSYIKKPYTLERIGLAVRAELDRTEDLSN